MNPTPTPHRGLPPLVGEGSELTKEEIGRYSRHLLIPGVGASGQRRLRNARVLVIGAGGLGSPVLMYLAAAGVGTIGVVEFDTVEVSNLQRQIVHSESAVGTPKGDSARSAIRALNSGVEVRWHDVRLSSRNAVNIFRQYDLIIDGTDNFATRYLVNDAAALAGKPYVWGAIYRFEGQVSVFWEAAPFGLGVNYRDLFPDPPAPGSVPSCAEGGVFGALCGTVGSLMATEAIKLVTGAGDALLGRVLIYDALTVSFRTIGIRKSTRAEAITELVDYDVLCGVTSTPVPVESEISARALADSLNRGEDVALIDVRMEGEWEISRLPGASRVPYEDFISGEALGRLPVDRPIVLYCKTGVRSAAALARLHEAGVASARHLAGGIEAWVADVDQTLAQY
ncbi:molybdopterin-synthase adenylyltransferase MoeB [Hoyosella rhizosphaerae]|uniref:molybdopterin-synthase adenylyltransferase MoeB n=1 Tax=Hoyosella rhizosphaerae TaxID=1755582 RepID=UPI001E655E19|nr:molybdopterin-synthase adenylyltransferase MoeB [Hoyosella rhizosphaerae]